MVLLCEVFKKRHGGGVINDELRILIRGEKPAPSLLINRLNIQRNLILPPDGGIRVILIIDSRRH